MIESVFQVINTVAKAKQSASSLESIYKMPPENSRVNSVDVRKNKLILINVKILLFIGYHCLRSSTPYKDSRCS